MEITSTFTSVFPVACIECSSSSYLDHHLFYKASLRTTPKYTNNRNSRIWPELFLSPRFFIPHFVSTNYFIDNMVGTISLGLLVSWCMRTNDWFRWTISAILLPKTKLSSTSWRDLFRPPTAISWMSAALVATTCRGRPIPIIYSTTVFSHAQTAVVCDK